MTVSDGMHFDQALFERMIGDFAGKHVPAIVERAIRAGALEIVADIRRTWPVDTGRSARAWQAGLDDARMQGTEIVVANDVEYAGFIEYGTIHIEPGNHLRRALRTARRQIPAQVRRAVRLAWRKGHA